MCAQLSQETISAARKLPRIRIYVPRRWLTGIDLSSALEAITMLSNQSRRLSARLAFLFHE